MLFFYWLNQGISWIGIDFLKKIGYNSYRNFMRLYNRNE